MIYQGVIIRWNDERGFGFIRENESTAEVFAHISAFSEKMPRPKQGESVSFTIIEDHSKKRKEAKNIHYLNRPVKPVSESSTGQRRYKKRNGGSHWGNLFSTIIALFFIGIVARFAYDSYQLRNKGKPLESSIQAVSNNSNKTKTSNPYNKRFTCDGRQHCSQMTSCEEAKYFLRNCPNTKMDGDGDGIPCERQWCS